MDGSPVISNHGYIPLLPLQWNWLHVCVAVSCTKKKLTVVVNGIKIGGADFPAINSGCPASLSGNLILQKHHVAGSYWEQSWVTVTNLNIFYGIMSEEGMVARTSGKDCGKQDGDLLSWTNSSWDLHGAAKWTEVSVEDLCREFSSIQLFTTQRVTKPDQCRHLCENMHGDGRMASVETPELFIKLDSMMRMLTPQLDSDGSNPIVVWLPIERQNGLWLDIYTNKTLLEPNWMPGFPIEYEENKCAVYGTGGYVNFHCLVETMFKRTYGRGLFCSCDFQQHPFLTLRGLCT